MLYLIIFLLILLILYIRGIFVYKNETAKILEKLDNSFGKNCEKDYSVQGRNHRKALLNRTESKNVIDDITWDDLDMDRVFERIDSCQSAIGEEYLYYLLHDVKADSDNLQNFENLVSYFSENPDERKNMQASLNRLGFMKRLSPIDYLDYITGAKKTSPVPDIIMDLLFIPAIVLAVYKPLMGFAAIFVLLVINIFLYFSRKKELDGLLACLAFLVRLSKESLNLINGKTTKDSSLVAGAINTDDELKKLLTKIKNSGNYLIASGRNNTGASAASSPVELFLNYINMAFHIDLIQYRILLKTLYGEQDRIYELLMMFGMLDAAISVSSFRKSLDNGYSIPEFISDNNEMNKLDLEDGYHPLIEKPVLNSIYVDKGVLLTGSNASGKSTFLRMVAINAILAQSINTVCAKKYSAKKFDVYSSIALKDNLFKGESYFIVEIKSLKRILDAVNPDRPVLCFVDEVLRGTNTVERISASKVILESLNKGNVLSFAATHDGELTELLKNEFYNYHFSEKVENGSICFDYRLQKGPATSRNALALLKNFGYSENIIIEAENLAHKLDGQNA